MVDWANGAGITIDGRNVTAADTLKCLVVKIRKPGEDWQIAAVLLPGDREADEKRLAASFEPAEVMLADEEDFKNNPFLVKGYVGPIALRNNEVPIYADPRVVSGTSWITGADAD